MRRTFLLCLSLYLIGCSDAGSPPAGGEFAIYTLQDRTIDARTALSYPMETVQLNGTPLLKASDLKSYSWSSHTFELKAEMKPRWEEFRIKEGNVAGVPFVVTVGSDRIYAGTFWWGYSSMMPPLCAVIQLLSANPYAILLMAGATDHRYDSRIRNALAQSGVLVD